MISLDEWVSVLKPKLDAEKDFRGLMSGVNIDDPIDLEEKTMDLRYRFKRLESELAVLRKTNSDVVDRVKGGANKNADAVRLAEKLKALESKVDVKKTTSNDE